MPKHIVLLTAGHLSSCPRLIKEAELLSKNGYSISIVFLNSISRIAELDKIIVDHHTHWNFNEVKWNKSKASILSKLSYELSNFFGLSSKYIQPTSKILIDKVLSIKADLYIAHHPSVLVAAALAAKKYNAKYGYDIEDAFPFVETNRYLDNPNKQILNVENKYIRGAAYTTTASPLYSEVYIKLYSLKNSPIDLLNVFDIVDENIEYLDRVDLQKVSFYWYSQTVGLNRGLQDLFTAINFLPENSFELHIRGMCSNEVKATLLSLVNSKLHKSAIYFHNSVSPLELNLRNREHDIGFALEASSSLNRDLCISNKILDYLRSGLMVVATNTQGHLLITNELKDYAISYSPGDSDSLAEQLQKLLVEPLRIKQAKEKSFQLAIDKYNWTTQSKVWLSQIEKLLK